MIDRSPKPMHWSDALLCCVIPTAVVMIPLWLAGCAPATKPTPPVTVVVTGCTALPRLQASRQDTPATKQAISAYIDKWDALCAPANGAKP